MNLNLCKVCAKDLKRNGDESDVQNPWQCCLCFGIVDSDFVDGVVAEVSKEFDKARYDSNSFVLALNLPITIILRNAIFDLNYRSECPSSSPSLKIRVVDSYLNKIKKAIALYPNLNSDLTITLTFINDEFHKSDIEFLKKNFPGDFLPARKRLCSQEFLSTESTYTKVRLLGVIPRLDANLTTSYIMTSPTRPCSFLIAFEREPLIIASRYCKFSRSLSQSRWNCAEGPFKITVSSVSEKIEAPLIAETNCESSRFIASGREDIDVRMLGYGRPFAVQLINPRLTKNFHGSLLNDTLKRLTVEINKDKDIRLPCNLQKINDKELNILKVGQDEKRKCYTAYCYYTQKLCVDLMENLQCKTPFQIIQKTPVRVLRRRPLLDRIRTIYNLHLLMLDDFHFLMRIETQAGTYVKEFVHGDFGRTRPSLAELLKVESGEMDILQLDVEKVDMEWPPRINLLD